MRYCVRLGFMLFALAGLAFGVRGQSRYRRLEDGRLLPPHINTINLIHVDFDTTIRVGSTIGTGQVIGQVQAQPLVRSSRYGMAIIASEDEYKAGRYTAAAARLEEAVRQEPGNPFITYQLARSLYRSNATKPRAYSLYQRLVQQLETAAPANDSTLSADIWFAEAYWKLGTLHMDNERWPEAIRSIAQFMAAAKPAEYAGPLQEQLLGYLTECFYHIQDAEMCRFYGRETLRLFPQNEYVQPYLAQLRISTKKPARKTSGRPSLSRKQ